MMSDSIERRKHIRYDFPHRIEYALNPETSDEIFKAVTINISKTGLCLYVFDSLGEGQKMVIRSTLPVPLKTVSVRWTKKIEDNFYKVGLMRT
jgi:c-di-GMP-binding flagellar brake protein YcgR